jgi:hypothetical protein
MYATTQDADLGESSDDNEPATESKNPSVPIYAGGVRHVHTMTLRWMLRNQPFA